MRRLELQTLSLFFLATAACTSGTQDLGDSGAGAPDATSIPDTGPPDGGEAPDAAAPDATVARRRLVEVKLFGDLPSDNAVLNPQFEPGSQSWLAIGDLAGGGRFVRTSFRELALTPARQPALLVPARTNDPVDTIVLGSVMASTPPLEASIWIGRDEADAAALDGARPALVMTLAASGEEESFDLAPDTEPPVIMEGRVWRKYSATIERASIGIINFAIQDPEHRPMYLHAPVVVGRRPLRASSPAVRPRALTATEAKAVRSMADWRRRRLGDGRRPEPEVPTEAIRGALRR